MKRNGNAKRRRRENRGAESGGIWGGGIPLPSGGKVWGGGRAPSPENFLSGNDAFWCILGACFNVSIRRVESKSSFVCQLPIGQLSHMADVSWKITVNNWSIHTEKNNGNDVPVV